MASVGVQTQPGIETLEQQRQETLEALDRLRADLRSMAEPTPDEADGDAYERERTWALVQTAQRKLDSIDRALELAQNGSYGICESCGERIEPARLQVLPTTTFCLSCQQQYERENKRQRR